eukprot:CAMPEP_0172870374 /NCGR_PEP_ID=MMETSP1075-20121228/91487_1 /TAXON_ID=2916 /ORGANISM="Ceratium fusus, Strain PA161109" /LENGTH=85 /DNA_ID=CAMNT_0013720507 /DNA_START=597 /DNA_END=854 /DNA_ORIENTATION=-
MLANSCRVQLQTATVLQTLVVLVADAAPYTTVLHHAATVDSEMVLHHAATVDSETGAAPNWVAAQALDEQHQIVSTIQHIPQSPN